MAFADYDDIVSKYDLKSVYKAAQYTVFDAALNEFVTVTNNLSLRAKIEETLIEAESILRDKMTCCFDLVKMDILLGEGKVFPSLKRYTVKIAMMLLREGNDCPSCVPCLDEFYKMCSCQKICTIDNICLEKLYLFSVEEKESCIPDVCNLCKKENGCVCAD